MILHLNTRAQLSPPCCRIRRGPHPEPEHPIQYLHPNCAVVHAHPRRPECTHLLEMERRMLRVGLQEGKCFVGECLNRFRQSAVAGPEGGRGVAVHNYLDCPSAWSWGARAANPSSFPALASASNCRPHASASNSASHRRNAASSSAESSLIWLSMSFTLLKRSLTSENVSHRKRTECSPGCQCESHFGRLLLGCGATCCLATVITSAQTCVLSACWS